MTTGVQNLDVNMERFRGDADVNVLAWRRLLLPGCSRSDLDDVRQTSSRVVFSFEETCAHQKAL